MAGEPLFLRFFDTADNMAIRMDGYNLAKPLTFAQLYRFCPIVWGFAKRFANFVIYGIFIYKVMNKILFVCHGRSLTKG